MIDKQCAYELCGELFALDRKKRSNKYCSRQCSGNDKTYRKIQSWLNGEWNGSTNAHGELAPCIKTFLIEEAGFKCTECGWDKINPTTGKCPLEVDHIDGDSTNNLRENLKVLCRNCHSLTPTFKALNKKGRGTRLYRKKYNQFEAIGRISADPNRVKCSCGNKKTEQSDKCLECRTKQREDEAKSYYPPIDEILEKVDEIGYAAYSRIIGKSDTAIRKYLNKNGIDTKKSKKIVKCKCGNVVEDRTYHNNFTTCLEHRTKSFEYPPVEEIIKGIQKFGIVEYARRNDIKYPSNIRKYLNRQGIELSISQRIK